MLRAAVAKNKPGGAWYPWDPWATNGAPCMITRGEEIGSRGEWVYVGSRADMGARGESVGVRGDESVDAGLRVFCKK